jgi:hypothetical protein
VVALPATTTTASSTSIHYQNLLTYTATFPTRIEHPNLSTNISTATADEQQSNTTASFTCIHYQNLPTYTATFSTRIKHPNLSTNISTATADGQQSNTTAYST